MVLWTIGLMGTFFGTIALIILFKSLSKTVGRLRKSFTLLLLAALVYILYATLAVTFGFLEIDNTETIWVTIPLLFVVAGGCWALSMLQFSRLIEEMSKKESKS